MRNGQFRTRGPMCGTFLRPAQVALRAFHAGHGPGKVDGGGHARLGHLPVSQCPANVASGGGYVDVGIDDAGQYPPAGHIHHRIGLSGVELGFNLGYLPRRDAEVEIAVQLVGGIQQATAFKYQIEFAQVCTLMDMMVWNWGRVRRWIICLIKIIRNYLKTVIPRRAILRQAQDERIGKHLVRSW